MGIWEILPSMCKFACDGWWCRLPTISNNSNVYDLTTTMCIPILARACVCVCEFQKQLMPTVRHKPSPNRSISATNPPAKGSHELGIKPNHVMITWWNCTKIWQKTTQSSAQVFSCGCLSYVFNGPFVFNECEGLVDGWEWGWGPIWWQLRWWIWWLSLMTVATTKIK